MGKVYIDTKCSSCNIMSIAEVYCIKKSQDFQKWLSALSTDVGFVIGLYGNRALYKISFVQ